MGWGQDKAQTLDLQGRKTPVLRVTRSRAVILLGINPAVCQTLQHGISQGVKLGAQSEAAFWSFPEAGTEVAQATENGQPGLGVE